MFAICYPDSLLFLISERNSLLSFVILGLVPCRKKRNLWSKFILCRPGCSGLKGTGRVKWLIPTIWNTTSMFKWAKQNVLRKSKICHQHYERKISDWWCWYVLIDWLSSHLHIAILLFARCFYLKWFKN